MLAGVTDSSWFGHDDGDVVVAPACFDAASVPEVELQLVPHLDSGDAVVQVDMSGVDQIDDMAVAMVLRHQRAARRRGGDLVLIGPLSESVRRSLAVTIGGRGLRVIEA